MLFLAKDKVSSGGQILYLFVSLIRLISFPVVSVIKLRHIATFFCALNYPHVFTYVFIYRLQCRVDKFKLLRPEPVSPAPKILSKFTPLGLRPKMLLFFDTFDLTFQCNQPCGVLGLSSQQNTSYLHYAISDNLLG